MTDENDKYEGDKSVINGDNMETTEPLAVEGEILPPDPDEEDLSDDRNSRTKPTKLTTVGQVKTEMAKTYRKANSGKMRWDEASRAIFVLRGLLKAIEIEHEHNLVSEDPDSDRPVLTGLQIVGPQQLTAPIKSHKKED